MRAPFLDNLFHSANGPGAREGARTHRKRLIRGEPLTPGVILTSESEVPTLAPLSSWPAAATRGPAASAGFRQVVGASQQFRGPPPPALIPSARALAKATR